jgi:predicted AAA+ superfamily ATPase
MNYYRRHGEKILKKMALTFSAALVTGARQVGKSTLLQHIFPDAKVIFFDPYFDEFGARKDPDLFLDMFKPPLILDEIQYVPELMSAIKRRLERKKDYGQYLMSGSQNLAVLKTVSESMAGRVAILHLEAMSFQELYGNASGKGWLNSYIEKPDSLLDIKVVNQASLPEVIWRGGMPGLIGKDNDSVSLFMKAYVETYIERDIRTAGNIADLADFRRFLELSSSMTAQEINHSEFGREIGYSNKTVRNWLSLLSNTYIWHENQPYSGNTIKRISKRPKGYIKDTGLACYLMRISSMEALASSPMLGPLFETWVINEIIRQSSAFPTPPRIYHWKTNGGAEVDAIIEIDGRFYPIEVKCSSRLVRYDAMGIQAFRKTYPDLNVMTGIVIYAGRDTYRLDVDTLAIPYHCFL